MIQITHEPLDPESITAAVRKGANGAVVTFLGSTRSSTGGRNVLYLEYEAYRPMADKVLAEIRALEAERGEFWTPAAGLVKLAEAGGRFTKA